MKRLLGQAGRTLGYFFHLTGMFIITVFLIVAVVLGGLAYRLSQGPLQIPWLTSYLANAVSGRGVDIHVGQAALAWAGFKSGAGQPLYLRLSNITVSNADGAMISTIPSAHLEFLPSALMGSQAPIFVSSSDVQIAGSTVPVALQARINLDRGLKLARADLQVTLGAGQLGPTGLDEPLASGAFRLGVTPGNVSITNGNLILAPIGKSAPVVGFSGKAHRAGMWHGVVTLTGSSVQAGDLFNYWPAKLVPITRHWVTKNIIAGSASNPSFSFGLSAPLDLSAINIDKAAGSFKADNVNLIWIDGVQPITALSGSFALTDLDDIVISADTGRLGDIKLKSATMHIAGVSHRDQIGTLNVPVSGSVQAALAVLNGPNLELLKQVPAPVLSASGHMTGSVHVALPMNNDLTLSQVDFKVDTVLENVTVPLPVDGLSFTRGLLTVDATSKNLQMKGDAMLAGEPVSVATYVDFQAAPGAQAVRFDLTTIADDVTLGLLGLNPGSAVAGSMAVKVQVLTTPANNGNLAISADLTRAALDLPLFGWKKPLGQPGKFNFDASINGDWFVGLSEIDSIDAKAPGLDIESQVKGGGLNLTRIHIGNTTGSGRIVPPANAGSPWQFDLLGDTVDVSSELNPVHKTSNAKSSVTAKPQPPSGFLWAATAHFDTLVLTPDNAPVLKQVYFNGNGRGDAVFSGTATAAMSPAATGPSATAPSATGPAQTVNLAITPIAGLQPGYGESLRLTTSDGGSLLRALGAYGQISGGTLNLAATYGVAMPISGTTTMTHFRLLKAPVVGKVLQGITVLGLPEAASGPGLEFSDLVAPFSIDDGIMSLKDGRAYSASLGFTASGTIDLNASIYDIEGTIVPAYALNALLGKIPLLGKIFSPEKGGGLIAMRYTMKGPVANPKVSVNPLSVITPGFLREIFKLPKALSKQAH